MERSLAIITSMSSPADLAWVAVLPIKHGAMAKSRLAAFAGDHRRELARAMAVDTVEATMRCAAVVEVIAVTSDPDAGPPLRELGAMVVPDVPDAGLNPALEYGAALARQLHPGASVAALSADIPALRAEELATVLAAAGTHASAFVPDAARIGTTTYCARFDVPFAPRFGERSREAHRGVGAVELTLDGIASVRRDVDTEVDLRAAMALGIGPRTAEVVAALLA